MQTSDERQVIRDAMTRLLSGDAIRSSGSLTIVALAEEAGVKRHLLTHRHTDLRDEFYDRVRAQGRSPHSEIKLRAEVEKLKKIVSNLREQNVALEAENALLRRMHNVLAVEKATAEEALRAIATGQVTSLFRSVQRDTGGPPVGP